jgi:thiosulfate dehydrogenase [quinone] large subunit
MLGLLMIGLSLLLGIGMKVAGYAGALMMLLMWSSHLPPQQNPILDEHIIYLLVFISFTFTKAGQCFGAGKWWSKTALVKKWPFLE